MRFIEKTDCKLFVSNRSVNALSTYKIKSMLLLPQFIKTVYQNN